MKKIGDLISTIYDIEIQGIAEDSRNVKEGYLFVATKGYNVDHFDYIDDAIVKGCVFLIVDREIDINFPHIIVDNINEFYCDLCQKYYDVDVDSFYFIGITGTDGKTTTSCVVNQIIEDCAYIGTNGLIIHNQSFPISNTTPCVAELYECLSMIQKENIHTIVMEVSSEALLHHRIDGLLFDIIAFTNITEDHLLVHKSFDNYLNCKLSFLDYLKDDGIVVVNMDDINLQRLHHKNMITFGKKTLSNCVILDIQQFLDKTTFHLKYHTEIEVNSPLFGDYNVYNVTEALLICLLYGLKEEIILEKIRNLSSIDGRGERLHFGQKYTIVLDYAHTINGVRNILDTYHNYSHIITVTGAAGGRDSYKRPIIGEIVMKKSDVSIFTMDDPRFENVDSIIDEMVGDSTHYVRIQDRREAIYYALSIASSNSVVIILGKGRDTYMAIGDKRVPYSDYDTIRNFFK